MRPLGGIPDEGGNLAFRVSRGVVGAAPLIRELIERSVADKAVASDALVARYLAPYVGEDGLNHLLALARAVDKEEMEEVDLGQIDRPTLIVWGDQDPFVGPKLGEILADTIPASRLVRLPGTGRLAPEEAPETLTSMILQFVGAGGVVRTD